MTIHKLITNISICLLTFFSPYTFAQKAPVFELPGTHKKVYLENIKGKVDGKKFTIVAANLDSSKADALKFLQNMPTNFDITYDPEGSVASKYNLKVMPGSYLIDKKGELMLAHKGYRESGTNENKINKLTNSI